MPALLLLWDAYRGHLGVNHVNFAIRTTGLIGLLLIVFALLITPLRRLTGWTMLIAVRRNLGVIGFFYLAVHFLIFFCFDRQASVVATVNEIIARRYLWFGTGALLLMVPLAITSTDAMISRLGPARWKALQRLSYVIALGGVIHYYLLVKSDVRQPLAFAAVVGALLAYRMVTHYFTLRASAKAATSRTAVTLAKTRTFWSGELTIARIFKETHDVKTIRLVPVDGGPLPFTHTAGQYLNLALTIDGKRVNRSYTIASPPTRNNYCEISVKFDPKGVGSRHLHETWHEGQRVKVSAPAGRFVFAGHEAERVLLIAGGVGITPMMSVIRSLTDRGWRGEIGLLYSVRAVRDIVFRQELDYLQSRFPNLRVETLVSMDPETPWDGLRGRINGAVISKFMPALAGTRVMLCGPAPMMTAMREILVGLGVPTGDVQQEEFASPPAVEETPATVAAADAIHAEGVIATIVFQRSGKTAEATGEQTLLEAAEDAGVSIPYECRSGICGQCKTRLVSGRVTMDVQDALTAGDRAKGFVLACQAHALQDLAVEA